MEIIIFGASGATGQEFVTLALAEGHHVTAFVRNASRLNHTHTNLRLVVGNALDRDAVWQAIAGHDVVVSCLGGPSMGASTTLSEMVANIVAGMDLHHVSRIVYMASAGIHREIPGIFGWIAERLLRHVLADHRQAVELIQQAGLTWTIARPMGLTNTPATGTYRTALSGVPQGGRRIARADVARFLLDATSDPQWELQSVGLA
jgi:putative NADH-flavin reductase